MGRKKFKCNNIYSKLGLISKKEEQVSRYFAREYQFSNSVIGTNSDLMATIMAFFGLSVATTNALVSISNAMIILQVVGGMAYAKTAYKYRFLRISGCLWRFFLPCIYFSSLLSEENAVIAMAGFYLLTMGCYQFGNSVQIEWLTQMVGENVDENYYLRRDTTWLVTYILITFLSGIMMDQMKKVGLQKIGVLVCGVAFTVLLGISLWYFFRLPMPKLMKENKTESTMKIVVREIITNRKFQFVLFLSMLYTFSTGFVGGFAAIYRIQVLGVSLAQVTLWSTIGYILRAFSAPIVSRITDKIGWKKMMGYTFLMIAATAIGWMLLNEDKMWFLFPLLSILLGMPHSVLNVGMLKLKIDATPEQNRSIYFSVEAAINGGVSMLGAVVSTVMIRALEIAGSGLLRYVFLVGAFGMIICAIITLSRKSKEE